MVLFNTEIKSEQRWQNHGELLNSPAERTEASPRDKVPAAPVFGLLVRWTGRGKDYLRGQGSEAKRKQNRRQTQRTAQLPGAKKRLLLARAATRSAGEGEGFTEDNSVLKLNYSLYFTCLLSQGFFLLRFCVLDVVVFSLLLLFLCNSNIHGSNGFFWKVVFVF